MDYGSLFDQTYNLKQELTRLMADPPVQLPTIIKLVQQEVERLDDLLIYMQADEVYKDEDGQMLIQRISIAFGLKEAQFIESLRNGLTDELGILNLHFQPPLLRIARFIRSVVQGLEQKLSTVAAGARNSRDGSGQRKKPDFASGSSAATAAAVKETERQGSPRFDDIIANAINTVMRSNPRGFLVYQVIGLLKQTAPNINVDDEDVKKLILEKCNAAISNPATRS